MALWILLGAPPVKKLNEVVVAAAPCTLWEDDAESAVDQTQG